MSANPYQSPETVGHTPLPPRNSFNAIWWWLGAAGVLVVMVLLLLPSVRVAREPARRMQCSNHLKQIGMALQNYHDEYGAFPPAYIAHADGKPMHSWRVLILPFIEGKSLYDQYKFDEPWNGPNNSKLHDRIPPALCCPSRSGPRGMDTSYVAVVGPETAWPGGKSIGMSSFTDGMSNSILVVEIARSGIHWMEPRDLDFAQMPMTVNQKGGQGVSSDHPNVALVVFADGHTAAISKNTPPDTLRRLLTIADGEPTGDYY